MTQGQDDLFGERRFLIVGAAAVIAVALALAFTPDDDGSTRTRAGDRPERSASQQESAGGFVRGRGGGLVDRRLPGVDVAGVDQTAGDADPTANPRTPTDDAGIRKEVADEMRERIGDEADTPEGERYIEDAATLVEGGSDVEQAVDEVLDPPQP